MSVRLTNWMKDKIKAEILDKRFKAEGEEIQKKKCALSVKIYNDVFSEKVRKQLSELPSGWVPEVYSLKVQFGDCSGVDYVSFDKENCVRIPFDKQHNCLKVYETTHKLAIEHEKLRELHSDLTERKNLAKAKINTVLNSCSTVSKLLKVWPECAPFVKGYANEAPYQLPAIQIADLNKLLKLKEVA